MLNSQSDGEAGVLIAKAESAAWSTTVLKPGANYVAAFMRRL